MGTLGNFRIMDISTDADFVNNVYSAFIIIDNTGAPFTINGTTYTPPNEWDGQFIPLRINGNTTTPNSNLMLLGNPKDPALNVTTGLITSTGGTEQYQFVNIKTGLPTNG